MGELKLKHRTYTKINTLYKRNMEHKSHHIIVGDYSEDEVKYLKDAIWECTLKIDGTNMHYQWDGHTLEIHGKTDKASIPPQLKSKMEELVTEDMMKEVFPLEYDEEGNEIPMMIRIYGEGCGNKIQGNCGKAYNPKENRFILFDVLVNGTWWLTRENCEDIANKLNLEIVPIIGYMTLSEAEELVKKGFKDTMAMSELDAEGLVCKPLYGLKKRNGDRIIVKIKTKDYRDLENIIGKAEEIKTVKVEEDKKEDEKSVESLDNKNIEVKDSCTFQEMLEILENGGAAILPDNGEIVFKQIPSTITPEVIPNLKSVPDLIKKIMIQKIENRAAENVKYVNQYVRMNNELKITYYTFSGNDINRNDWYCFVLTEKENDE